VTIDSVTSLHPVYCVNKKGRKEFFETLYRVGQKSKLLYCDRYFIG